MQNGYRWIVREKNSSKWIQKVTEASKDGIVFSEDVSDALRYATRFRAEDDASYLTNCSKMKDSKIPGMFFEVYEFEDSDRSKQTDPYLVFTPSSKKEKSR